MNDKPIFKAALAASLALVSGSALASGGGKTEFPFNPEPSMADKLPNPPIPLARGVKVWRDVVYQQQPGYRPQIVDIYVPAGKRARPLIVYIHGGGWFGGHTRQSGAFADFPGVLANLAARGFTVASIEYRLSGEARFPAQLRDVNAAIRFLRANAGQYRIDPARVGAFGGSAGGHLAALAALTCRDTALDPDSGQDGCIQAAVAWYGIHDFAALPTVGKPGSPEQRFLGCDGPCPAEPVRAASPIAHADAGDPPLLLIHGELDRVVPVAQSRALEARLRAVGAPVEALYIAGVDHSYVGTTPAETAAASTRAIDATFDFFHRKLGVPAR